MRPQRVTVRGLALDRSKDWRATGEILGTHPAKIRRDHHHADAGNHSDRLLDGVFTHLRAHVAELRSLEGAGAKREELEERRALIGQLQQHLAEVVRTTLTDVNRSDRR
jgi:hypothetical protein